MTVAKFPVSAIFHRPFRLPGQQEAFPPGEYLLRVETAPEKSRLLIHLQRQPADPESARIATVALADIEAALAAQRFCRPALDDLLADPMVRLFMASDGVTDDEIRALCVDPPGAAR